MISITGISHGISISLLSHLLPPAMILSQNLERNVVVKRVCILILTRSFLVVFCAGCLGLVYCLFATVYDAAFIASLWHEEM